MSGIIDLYFPITEITATAQPSLAYLWQMIYVAKFDTANAGTETKYLTLTKALLEGGIAGLDPNEVPRLQKAFSRGMAKIYLAVTANGETYDYTKWNGIDVKQSAFTQIVSPDLTLPSTLPSTGIIAKHVSSVPSTIPAKGICEVYDTEKEGKALGIFADVLSKARPNNNQFRAFTEYTGLTDVGVVSSLKDKKATYLNIFEGTSDPLLYWAIGGKAPADYYIYEMLKFELQNGFKGKMQLTNPFYTDTEIMQIEKIANDILGVFSTQNGITVIEKAKAPRKAEQTSANIENFKVDGLAMNIELPSQIYDVGMTIRGGI